MARLPRLYFPDCPLHIIQRGNNREACFFDEDDYALYLSKLKDASKKYKVFIDAFVQMTNHVHLLATPSDDIDVSCMMQSLGRFYVRYINTKYESTGTLWEGLCK